MEIGHDRETTTNLLIATTEYTPNRSMTKKNRQEKKMTNMNLVRGKALISILANRRSAYSKEVLVCGRR